MKLSGLFKEAYEKAGVPLPEVPKKKKTPVPARQDKKSAQSVVDQNKTRPEAARKKSKIKQPARPVEQQKSGALTITASGTHITRWTSAESAVLGASRKAISESKRSTEAHFASTKNAERAEYDYSITASAHACVTWSTLESDRPDLLMEWPVKGREIHLSENADEKFLCLGLDFGTSTLKAVISDNERQITYAVPFLNLPGVNGYLLPCRVYMGEQGYNLSGDGLAFRDLKLALLANPDSVDTQLPVVGFLALALRMIRGWLLSNHGETYAGPILWDLAMGLPVSNRCDEKIAGLYRLIGCAAWIVSAEVQLTPEVIRNGLLRAEALCSGAEADNDIEDIDVKVEPEIAAQIYGFVSSGAYDPNASNIYLMVDVGAGTLDASVFRVERKKGQRKDSLVIFKTTVEPHGVMNLHKKRMSWLQKALERDFPERTKLHKSVEAISSITDAVGAIPEDLDGYFSGLSVQFKSGGPDKSLYTHAKRQVAQNTYGKVESEKLLSKQHMSGMPMFLCGGGSRSAIYAKLKVDMLSAPGFSWFGVTPKPLQKPRGLVAPGLLRADYDRLSVAYGLSQLKLDKLIVDVPPLTDAPQRVDFSDRYIEK
ncbi:hypothetical protein G7015_21740 [Pseudomonas kunmingensis]|uniref:hypothetical protein n=1 Tax=Stutzerimonas kunmingensis TaxID=1211807 RepID=UPI0015E40469|nr:hypothetical protein [Stutzerimonas kunmingensis]MBA1241052.1 hypothetical protein [Stutzerimonas kunmingensis]